MIKDNIINNIIYRKRFNINQNKKLNIKKEL